MKPLLLLAILTWSAPGARAQGTAEPSAATLQKCLLSTSELTWNDLHLSADQLERMRRVQQACREECEKAVKVVDNPISNADGSTVLSEVKNILSADQYRDWLAYCTKGSPR